MELNDKFGELLGKIRPTDAQRKNLQDAPYPIAGTADGG